VKQNALQWSTHFFEKVERSEISIFKRFFVGNMYRCIRPFIYISSDIKSCDVGELISERAVFERMITFDPYTIVTSSHLDYEKKFNVTISIDVFFQELLRYISKYFLSNEIIDDISRAYKLRLSNLNDIIKAIEQNEDQKLISFDNDDDKD
jgi:hypothetical protein